VNQQAEHLSNAQIEQYGNPPSGARSETEAWVEAHLDDCSLCRRRVLEFQRTQFALLPDPKVNTVPTSDCPSEEDLRNLAAGLCPESIAGKLRAHAAACNHCRPLLQEYTEDFSDESTAEEQAFLNQLRTSSPEWQEQTAREMLKRAALSGTVHSDTAAPFPHSAQTSSAEPPGRKNLDKRHLISFPWKWITAPAVAAACAIIALGTVTGIWYARRDTAEKVEKWLAQSYKEKRTIDMRWPGVAWGEPKETLGPATLNQPRTLLTAQSAIQKQSPETLKKPEWLHLEAQSQILSGTPSKRLIDDLTRATESDPASQPLLYDLAIANFRMGEVTGDDKYYLQAKKVLDKMLASFPPSSAALFDRAVAEERLQLKEQALADLNQCLPLENDPAWAAEIRDKIRKLENLP
jgi:hypothetical protein